MLREYQDTGPAQKVPKKEQCYSNNNNICQPTLGTHVTLAAYDLSDPDLDSRVIVATLYSIWSMAQEWF